MREQSITELHSKLESNTKPIVVVSDFDRTLCHDYVTNPAVVDREPLVSDEVIFSSRGLSLIIATSRRINHPKVLLPWECGLVDELHPLILENGGIIAWFSGGQIVETQFLVDKETINTLHNIETMFCDIVVPTGAELVVKRGETMLLAILRDRMARPLTKHHTWLTKTLRDRIDIDGIEVVNTHDSVTIQSADVNKAKGFLRLLDELGINRNSIFMISMGDGENDVPMFHEADMSIAFGDNRKVTPYADLNMGADSLSASRALNVIREHARRVGSVYLGKPEIIRELDTQVA